MQSHSKENAAIEERDERPFSQMIKADQVPINLVEANAEEQAPISGGRPNKAGLGNDVVYANLASSIPQPSRLQHQRRLLSGSSSLKRYLRSFRAFRSASEIAATASLEPDISERSGGGITNATQHTRATSFSEPSQINLDVENYPYSRDAAERCTSRKLDRRRTSSADEYRRSIKHSLNRVPEEMEAPQAPSDGGVESGSGTSRVFQNNTEGRRSYGSVGYSTSPGYLDPAPRIVGGALHEDDDSDLSEAEEEWLLDEELAKQGLYRGNYKNIILVYTLVPLSTLLAFVFLALLPSFAFPTPKVSDFPYPPYLPFPLPELLVATALWALSYLLQDFLHATSVSGTSIVLFPSHRFPTFIPILTSILSAFLQSISSLFFRLIAVPLLLIPYYSTEHVGINAQPEGQDLLNLHKRHFPTWQDDAFRRVWWVALGWAAAEAVVGIKQGFESISLYKDVLVFARRKEVNYLEARWPRDDEERNAPPTREMADHLRSITPTQTRLLAPETSLTPTQRRPLPINLPPPATRSELSESMSSISSVRTANAGQRSMSSGLGEREPLLKLDIRPEVLKRRTTDELSGQSAESEVERDLDQLLALKTREELEELYGIPVIRIPVAISCLHRINSILFSLGIYLLIASAYMRSTFAYRPSPVHITHVTAFGIHQDPPSNKSLAFTLPPLLLLQVLLSMIHTPWILPRIGIHTFVYVGLLASLGLFFGGLGVWEVLT